VKPPAGRGRGADALGARMRVVLYFVAAEQANARYTPEATTWVKIKSGAYSQAVGREEFFI
jgi:hypothetical protein